MSLSTAGYFRLSWTVSPNTSNGDIPQFELQQATQADFSDAIARYQGADRATVISGLANNTYYYRVRLSNEDDWSKTVAVEVKHHPLSRAFSFFALGIAMFIITVTVLLKGARQDPKHDST